MVKPVSFLLVPFLFCLLLLPSFSENPEKIYSSVTDYSGALSQSERANLSNLISSIERENDVQIAIYIEKNIPKGTTIEERSLLIAETNGIGDADSDNGLLLYVATDDNSYRWETGYGLEGKFSSAYLGRVSRETIVPNFRQGDYYAGISLSLGSLFKKAPPGNAPSGSGASPIIDLFAKPVLFLLALVFLMFSASILLSWHFSALMSLSVARRIFSRKSVDRAEAVYLFQSAVFSIGVLFPLGFALREYSLGFSAIVLVLFAIFVALPALVRILARAFFKKESFWQGAEGAYLQDVSNGVRMRKKEGKI